MSEQNPPVALTIAGSDSGGGAGIQADIKAMTHAGVHCLTAITALTAQNSEGVRGIEPVPPEFVRQQIETVTDDFHPRASKTGMLFSEEIIGIVCDERQRLGKLVVDPVMVAESGDSLLDPAAETELVHDLLPEADVVTPNRPEMRVIADHLGIHGTEPLEVAAEVAGHLQGPVVLIKGGHSNEEKAIDYAFSPDGENKQFSTPRHPTDHTHGSGCAYSSLITAHLARGLDPMEAISRAKTNIDRAIKHGFAVGNGPGTLNFLANVSPSSEVKPC